MRIRNQQRLLHILLSVAAVLPAFLITEAGQPRPPVVYTTPARNLEFSFVPATSSASGAISSPVALDGRANYTLTSVGDDDSLSGTFTIILSNVVRQKIAEITQSKVDQVAETYSRKNVPAKFAKGTACPSIDIEFAEVEIDVTGGRIATSGAKLVMPESADRLVQLMCFLTRQINANLERRGIVRSINRTIEGDK